MSRANAEARRDAFSSLGSRLAHMDDRCLRSALKSQRGQVGAWGGTYTADLDGMKVFVKRIPLTELEAARPWSTRNHFRLPPYYNYGVGSAGFGAWRELIAHITTTGWVLAGLSPSFPMLLHHRVMARIKRHRLDEAAIEGYVKRWNGSQAVGRFMRARAEADHEIWLVLEHIPHGMSDWLMTNQERVAHVVDQLCAAISLLGRNGMVHFDAHFGNVLTDGETVYLADFGLLNHSEFDLTKPEHTFLARHSHYDYAEAIFAVGLAPLWALWSSPKESQAAALEAHEWLQHVDSQRGFAAALIDNLDTMTTGPLEIAPPYAEVLRRYHEVVLYMAGFLDTMRGHPRKNTPYDDEHVRRLLEEAGAPIG